MTYDTILVSTEAAVATVTLNRPAVMNGLDTTLRRELTDAVTRAPDTARALVLTGAGSAFCSGQDLSAGLGADVETTLRDEYEPLIHALHDCPIPTIAAVNGPAAGAGANLALACDLVIAAESAVFIQAFARIGLIPDAGGTWLLPRQVGLPRALGAALLAEPITARDAAAWGLIWQAVPDADFPATIRARAAQLAAGPTEAYRLIKQALRASPANDLPTQLALEARLQAEAAATADFREGVAAFLEKRPARFEGR